MGVGEPERWVRVAPSWLGHRAEPLIHERMWGCPRELPGHDLADDGRLHQAGFDAAGRSTGLRRLGPDGEVELETVERRSSEIVVHLPGVTTATTTLDEHGRAVRTVYTGRESGEEIYHYDTSGRLIAIDESESLWRTLSFYEMWDPTGGRLTVTHDERGPLRLTDCVGGVRWERCEEPWEQLLDRGAAGIHEGVVRVCEDYCRAEGVPPATEVFALLLTYVAQGSLHVTLTFGLEADRRAWLAADLDPDELAARLWYINRANEGLHYPEGDVIDEELDSLLLREAALNQPDDPYRVVLNAAAAKLARHDWSSVLTTTDDFVVYIAEHDEGIRPKYDSLRAVNPPERLELWDARWPAGAHRGEDEPLY
jgi:hypothetical protein